MTTSYQIIQERFKTGCDVPTQDDYPILFASVDEAKARVKRDGLGSMFEHEGDSHYIAELDGVSFTGRTYELSCPPLPSH